jgi:predicted DNA-binding protein
MTAPEKIKLTLEMSPQLYASLETLAQKTGDDKADVLRKAIAMHPSSGRSDRER